MSGDSNCRCETFTHPAAITNPPGRTRIAYRPGDYSAFRRALLQALPGEIELAEWKPTPGGDLALQMVEWWAYLADILTFYNERIANQDYLLTADLEESVKRLIHLLGYRPRPGIGAMATLAALVGGNRPVTIPQGFAVQSKPGPGQQPQIFELDADTTVSPLDEVSADSPPVAEILGADGTVLLQGTVSSIKPGDRVLLVRKNWNGDDSNYAIVNVAGVKAEADPRGSSNTRVSFGGPLTLPAGASAADYRLMRSTQSTRLWQYNGSSAALVDNGNGTSTAHLESVVRQIQPGDILLLTGPGGPFGTGGVSTSGVATAGEFLAARIIVFPPFLHLASVRSYTEALWYANSISDPSVPPPAATPPISILHSQITFAPSFSGIFNPSTLVILFGWEDAGTLIPTPARNLTLGSAQLDATSPPQFPTGSFPVLIEGANGAGIQANGFTGSDPASIQVSNVSQNPSSLATPVNVLYNLLKVSRGSTIKKEVLGSGDSGASGQEFVLKKSPLTYLLSSDSSAGGNYKSTLRVWVNGIEWFEVPSFYGQSATATVFVTREDEKNQTHVAFGDGVNGARLPSGTNNVIADYRFGSGAQAPDAGTLTSIVAPYPGVTAVRNPVKAAGGADPEPASQIRRYAPLSVLTFGRAVSGDDYEAIAALTPGVARARAYWSFDALQQRTAVTVYVGDDDGARTAALAALRGDADPNRPVIVKLAQAVPLQLSLVLEVDPKYIAEDVAVSVRAALLDPDSGLFGSARVRIGEAIYISRVYAACLSVPGALSVHHLQASVSSGMPADYRLDPGEGSYLTLDANDLSISTEALTDAG
jgi:hypothetical protein